MRPIFEDRNAHEVELTSEGEDTNGLLVAQLTREAVLYHYTNSGEVNLISHIPILFIRSTSHCHWSPDKHNVNPSEFLLYNLKIAAWQQPESRLSFHG